ncbi:helix-turn-helix domain-containing protein [Ensifer aridi]|uniref:helix-turn-helix domain-containing protein n=1 Tax=Ensifer aridi TaxID=1708715 RepID=UPI001FCDC380|nr:helix-turn-helix domain-containing protein [Ensifer aridi]
MFGRLLEKRKPDPIDVEVGRRVRARRLFMGMTQTGLAEAVGVTYQQIQKYENGRSKLGPGRLQAIADAFDVPLSYFFNEALAQDKGQAPDCEPDRALVEFLTSPMGITLNRSFHRIADERVRRAFLSMVEQIGDRDEEQRVPKQR